MTSIDAARTLIRQQLSPLRPRRAVLTDSLGATLAETLCTTTALPAVDVSAMDGYAVCGDGDQWILRPDIQIAGPALVDALRDGEAVRIGTGAPVPAGSTMVIRDEYIVSTTIADKPAIARRSDSPVRDDTRRRGENWPAGAQLAPSGQRVSLSLVSAALSAETPTAEVRGPLRAQLILTGDEIRSTGHLAIGQTRDSLGAVLPHYLRALDIDCIRSAHAPDHPDRIRDILTRHCDADVVFVVGATRHGPADYLRPVLAQLNADTLVDGLDCRPAGTQIVARLPSGPVIHCLPGNPYAALAALLILAPALVDALTGRTPRPPTLIHIPGAPELAVSAATRVLPAISEPNGDWHIDQRVRTPHLAGLIGRDALVLIPPQSHSAQPVEIITVPS